MISSDTPKDHPDDDRLGYKTFAKHLAESLISMPAARGLVVSINGSWGSGKSTLMNFLDHYLEREKFKVIYLNPWWLSSGAQSIAANLISAIKDEIVDPTSIIKWTVRGLQKRLNINDALKAIVAAELPGLAAGAKVLDSIVEYRRNMRDIKEALDQQLIRLGSQQKRIVVLIDDIDRLSSDEIKSLFRAIKTVGDLRNVIYVLAFDQEVVAAALQGIQGDAAGESYLAKIVQAPFHLPLLDRSALKKMFVEQLSLVLGPYRSQDNARWSLILEIVHELISTPRDVVRFINTFQVSFSRAKDEVNPVDFFAIEALRIFCHPVYDLIKNNQSQFIDQVLYGSNLEDDVALPIEWMTTYSGPVTNIVAFVFPKVERFLKPDKSQFSSELPRVWRKDARVCSDLYFRRYFQLALPPDVATPQEMLKTTECVNEFETVSVRYLMNPQLCWA